MKLFGIAGWKNQGKTTLVVALVREFRRRGLRVATVKHAHHAFDIDTPGKDSHRHREAGAGEVLVASARRFALMHENDADGEPDLDELLARLSPADIVLVEGFKHHPHPKIEAVLDRGADPSLAATDDTVLAVVSGQTAAIGAAGKPLFRTDEIARIADFILDHAAETSERTGDSCI